jgi:hypothetical protein
METTESFTLQCTAFSKCCAPQCQTLRYINSKANWKSFLDLAWQLGSDSITTYVSTITTTSDMHRFVFAVATRWCLCLEMCVLMVFGACVQNIFRSHFCSDSAFECA